MPSRLRRNWPEYLIEAWALGTFMVSAGVFTLLFEHPDFGLRGAIESEALRRLLIGLAMGATAIALIYSPWGQRSGAHMNPAVTLAFLALGKVARTDALYYIGAQFAGGAAGVALVLALAGARFAGPPVDFVITRPGHGAPLAFALEAAISCVLMSVVLALSSRARIARYTGLAAGALVATFIALEAPCSGMSMNPARSFASAVVAGNFADLWIYFVAPPLGMGVAALWHRRPGTARAGCAKLVHGRKVRCIHCGYEPRRGAERFPIRGLTNVNAHVNANVND
jgi:aquaporin Z